MSDNEGDNEHNAYEFPEEPISFELLEESTSFELLEEFASFDSNYKASNNVSISSSSAAPLLEEQSPNGIYDVCKVKVMNLSDKEVEYDHKFIYDDSTRNMCSHLQSKHDLYENQNKNHDYTIQQTIPKVFEQVKVIKMHKES
ncbi:25831_t:CDS:2 [Dentiscutata erythropus]|uniref:25831_t:CDS:1 n=1 Tax=Dentiscutata erythropus TaxID=1348616 RepID=A0A9N8Z7W3_9GLOM|nr:25831_t:CDS:2 [Dentiscutata erythropus]